MANNFNTFTATQTTALSIDLDGDGVIDPGDTVTNAVTITNNSPINDAPNVSFNETLSGMTQTGGITVTPIAFNDSYNASVDAALVIDASAGVLANDIDPNASVPLTNTGLTAIDVDNTGTHGTAVLNTDGSFTFTPEPGFAGTTSFKYTAHDAEGLNSNVAGTVTLTVDNIANAGLLAAPGGVAAPAADTARGTIETHLTQAELDAVVNAAIARWESSGLTAAQDAYLNGVTFTIADMSGLVLGSATPGHITLDGDAAGYGWYLDATPGDDAEFAHTLAATRLQSDPSQVPAGHIDLLTTVAHELGHQLGLDDSYAPADRDSLMYGYLVTGERRLPAGHQADRATPGSVAHEEFLASTVAIGTLPANMSVTVTFQATIASQTNKFIVDPENTATVFSDSPFPASTDSSSFTTTLDSLTLGGTIFDDANGNSVFDSGTEAGVDGVTVALYVDNGSTVNVFDAGDTQIATTTAAGGGNYSFAGLAPGDYIVVIPQANFDSGGALEFLPVSVPGFPEPDNNVDNDDNGARGTSGGGGDPAYTKAITLDYNTEPTSGIGNDTNTTLDLGFVASAIDPPPEVNSIVRADANPTNAGTVHYTVTFSEAVTGVDATDFALATSGVSGASITGVTGSGTTYTVTVNEGSGDGTVGLNFVDDDTVVDAAGNPRGGPGAIGGFTGQVYTIDKTAPEISGIVRADADPTNAGTVHYTVTFSEAVTGVDATDFVLATSGVSGASITGVTGSGTTYTVTVNEGSGDGTIGLNFVDDDTVVDAAGNPRGGPGANGGFTGQVYTVDKTAPVNDAPRPFQWGRSQDLGSHGVGWQVGGVGDFNHDATSDVLWHNATTGQVDEWQMANGNWTRSQDLGIHNPAWQVAGIGDFNGDGTSDVLWRNPSTGQLETWIIADRQWSRSVDLGSHGTDWQVAGVGDFNGDHASDILFRNTVTGQVDEWRMANGNWAQSISLGSFNTAWQFAGIGDFDGDGNSDVLWRNPTTGQVNEWHMLGGQWANSVDLGSFNPAYQVAAVNDFNGDGTSDVLWRNPTTGQVEGWVMQNTQWSSSVSLGSFNTGYQLAGTGDFDHSLTADALWHNPTTGQVEDWLLIHL